MLGSTEASVPRLYERYGASVEALLVQKASSCQVFFLARWLSSWKSSRWWWEATGTPPWSTSWTGTLIKSFPWSLRDMDLFKFNFLLFTRELKLSLNCSPHKDWPFYNLFKNYFFKIPFFPSPPLVYSPNLLSLRFTVSYIPKEVSVYIYIFINLYIYIYYIYI